jgi:hypothetical protein
MGFVRVSVPVASFSGFYMVELLDLWSRSRPRGPGNVLRVYGAPLILVFFSGSGAGLCRRCLLDLLLRMGNGGLHRWWGRALRLQPCRLLIQFFRVLEEAISLRGGRQRRSSPGASTAPSIPVTLPG